MASIEPSIMVAAFDLKPADATLFLRQRGIAVSWNWYDRWKREHATAFTAAKVAKLDLLQRIKDAVDDAVENGETFAAFKKRVTATATPEDFGAKTKRDMTNRLTTIFRTNAQTAYMAGRYVGMKEVATSRPWWQYVAVGDARTRPEHAALNGRTFRNDDPFWNTHYPPNGFNCRCSARTLSDAEVRSAGITTESGADSMVTKEITVGGRKTTVTGYKGAGMTTPVFTDPGWDYNPARESWKPDLSGYDPALAEAYRKDEP